MSSTATPASSPSRFSLSGWKLALSLIGAFILGILAMIGFAFAYPAEESAVSSITPAERERLQQIDSIFNSTPPLPASSESNAAVAEAGDYSDMDKIGSETLAQFGVGVTPAQFALVAPAVCDSYDAGGDLSAAEGVVESEIGISGWEATKVVQMAVVQRCGSYSEQTY